MKAISQFKQLKTISGKAVPQCLVCPNKCIINEGKSGYCSIRINQNDQLYNTDYGQFASIAIDPIEKKPLYHFRPGSAILSVGSTGCNLRCHHCQNWYISQPFRTLEQIPKQAIDKKQLLRYLTNNKLRSLAFTYNEPFINIETLIDYSSYLKTHDINIVHVTNGYISQDALAALLPISDAFSIDLKAFSSSAYKQLTQVDCFENILEVIEIIATSGKHLELVTNLVTGINDSLEQIQTAAKWIYSLNDSIPWHISTFRPCLDMEHNKPIDPKFVEEVTRIGKREGIKHLYSRLSQHTLCSHCHEPVITRSGFTVTSNYLDNGHCPKCNKPLSSFVWK